MVAEVFPHLGTTHVFVNIEYEVDELRRDIATVKLGRDKGVDVACLHDRLVVPPGKITSKAGKPMSVFRWVWRMADIQRECADGFQSMAEGLVLSSMT